MNEKVSSCVDVHDRVLIMSFVEEDVTTVSKEARTLIKKVSKGFTSSSSQKRQRGEMSKGSILPPLS